MIIREYDTSKRMLLYSLFVYLYKAGDNMREDKKQGLKNSKTISAIIIVLAVLEMIFVFTGNHLQMNSSKNLQNAYNNQLEYRMMASQLKETSDYLSNEVRMFAVTGDIEHFRNYWNEIKNDKHREEVIQELENMDIPADEERSLERAKYFSDTLMHIEISSMRLKLESKSEENSADASGIKTSDAFIKQCMDYVCSYELESDYICEPSQEAELSIQILYGSSYMAYKDLIDTNIANFQEAMNARLEKTVDNARHESDRAYILQTFCGIGELGILIFIVVLFQKWYIKPIVRYKKHITRQHGRRKMFVEPEGVWELQEFAREFNALSSDMLSELAKSERIEKELIEAKGQAEKANRVKSQFLAQMSHELRTPLNTISGYLFLLEETKLSGEQQRYTRNMHLATNILLEEINEILDYSKLESGKMKFEDKNFNLRDLTESLKGMLDNEAEQRNIGFNIIIDDDVPEYIYGDPLRLKQVLTNLIFNGFKFTKEGSVTLLIKGLNFSKTRCILEFSVSDTGIGIKKDQQQSIFKAFAQADESITRKYGGTGLGLPICRKIVEEMSKGRYSLLVESEYGKGSCFYFDMDFAYGRKETKKRHSNTHNRKIKRKISILIVDDNKINLVLESEVLHKFGYIADVESDPRNVIDRMKEQDYDIVFLDISMPYISGYELAKLIRKNPKWKDIVIIALTANIGEDIEAKAKEAGMSDYLPKPIPMEELQEKLEKYTDDVIVYQAGKSQQKKNTDTGKVQINKLEEQFYGDKEAVKELFDIFVEDNADFKDKIKKAAKIPDYDTLEMEIHRIKGVSGNLLCTDLEKSAQKCLDIIKEKVISDSDMNIMFDELDAVIEFMQKYVI